MQFGSRKLSLDTPHIMGVLNVTPDSFSDGGRFIGGDEKVDVDACLRTVERMQQEGATFVDIGGESTRPGAAPVSFQQEQDRVVPVIEKVAANVDIIISLDTSNPELIEKSAGLGAGLINDVRALERPGAMQAAAQSKLPVCLMHMQGNPQTMQHDPNYDSVVNEVASYLLERVEACEQAGIEKDKIMLDPGIGFGKSVDHNRHLLLATQRFKGLGFPVLVGVSRKSLIGKILQRQDPSDRLAGSLALAFDQFQRGANILRVHDVRETSDMLKIYQFLEHGS